VVNDGKHYRKYQKKFKKSIVKEKSKRTSGNEEHYQNIDDPFMIKILKKESYKIKIILHNDDELNFHRISLT